MVFPIIPILAIAAIVGGVGTLIWYSNLSAERKEAADRRANELAKSMFNKALNQLTSAQAKRVLALVKSEFSSGAIT